MPRPNVSEERINQILDAAITVFARDGFDEARMEDIAVQANLSKGAVYLYFKSKDAIIAAILRLFLRREIRSLPDAATFDGVISDYLLTFIRSLASTVDHMRPLLPVAFEFYAIAGRRHDIRQLMQDYFSEYRQALAAGIQVGIDRGEFRAVDPDMVAIALISLFEGLTLLWMVDPHTVSWRDQAEQSVQLMIDALRVPK
jgi:AcrR family transcriptional regulator